MGTQKVFQVDRYEKKDVIFDTVSDIEDECPNFLGSENANDTRFITKNVRNVMTELENFPRA